MPAQLDFTRKPLIGMVHVRALPGTPKAGLSVPEIVRVAVAEARMLRDGGFDAVMLENMHDAPYLNRAVGPEICACMAVALAAVRDAVDCPLGVQVLAGANREALAAALASGAQFIRAEGFVFAHVADEGIIASDAGELLRYRKAIGAESIAVFADIKKKHSSHAITSDVDLAETAHAAEFFGADGVVVTGVATGSPTNADDLRSARHGTRLPILVGSGVTPESLGCLWELADAFIVGSSLKAGGEWCNDMEADRVAVMVSAAAALRGRQRQ
jgi:hypothetical protein